MAQKVLRKYGEAATIDFALFGIDGVNFKVDAAHASGDTVISKDEGAEANTANGFSDEGKTYSIILSAAEMTCKRAMITIADQGTKVWLDDYFIIETYGHASAMHVFNLDYDFTGYNETLKLKMLDIENDAGDALRAASTGGNGYGGNFRGHGYASGIFVRSGADANAKGMEIEGRGASASQGLYITSTNGNALHAECLAPLSGHGAAFIGYGTGKHGLYCQGDSGGAEGDGIHAEGRGTGRGIYSKGGETAPGTVFEGGDTSGDGFQVKGIAGNGNGAVFSKHGTGLPVVPNWLSLTDVVDGVTIENIYMMQLAMINGKFTKNVPATNDIRFYKQDNSTPAFTVHVTDTERTRL